jgi:hypothetical protein
LFTFLVNHTQLRCPNLFVQAGEFADTSVLSVIILSSIIVTDDSDLGGDVPDVRNGKRAAVEDFAAYVDRMVETSDTGVIVVTHEPVIRAIGIISGLDSADIHSDEIGEITIVK